MDRAGRDHRGCQKYDGGVEAQDRRGQGSGAENVNQQPVWIREGSLLQDLADPAKDAESVRGMSENQHGNQEDDGGCHARQFFAGFVESYDAGQENDDSCRPGDDDLGKPAWTHYREDEDEGDEQDR
ncbi:hypothetical protein G9444_3804 [Rhodococcus erythropolis]|uniref:Uncharacterized protein n=1 Tax=Rhodococcus erythropolis TaxID=1833 RepID=A0A6G9CVX6_RHOER|nr:hypothetical protein G9444_3804 [Rhodococcus erythropolis]